MPAVFNRIKTMQCYVSLLAAVIIILTTTRTGVADTLTQRIWMTTLVDTLDLSFGLPDEPQDPDYINILLGSRTFRFEAEDVYAPREDEVSLMAFRNFGDFSGKGWLQGVSKPTQVHLRFVLPLGGNYQLSAVVRRGEHSFTAGEQTFNASGDNRFTRVDLGELSLAAGPQEILVTLAPAGAIDYIELTAPALPPISPLDGWQPEEPLQWETLHTTVLQALNLGGLLPPSEPVISVEAEQLPPTQTSGTVVVEIPHLGKPSDDRWLRAGAGPAEVSYTVELSQGGFFDSELRLMGTPVEIAINDRQVYPLTGKSYLADFQIGTFCFFEGHNKLAVHLPPGGGLDRIKLLPRRASAIYISNLLGLGQTLQQPTISDLDRLATLVAAFAPQR